MGGGLKEGCRTPYFWIINSNQIFNLISRFGKFKTFKMMEVLDFKINIRFYY